MKNKSQERHNINEQIGQKNLRYVKITNTAVNLNISNVVQFLSIKYLNKLGLKFMRTFGHRNCTGFFTKNDTKVVAYQIGQKDSCDPGHVAKL